MSRLTGEGVAAEDHTGARRLDRDAEHLADRLHSMSRRWDARRSAADTEAADRVREGLQQLADLGADAEGRGRRRVPVLAPRALADQLLVLAHDVGAHGERNTVDLARQFLADLRRAL